MAKFPVIKLSYNTIMLNNSELRNPTTVLSFHAFNACLRLSESICQTGLELKTIRSFAAILSNRL